MLNILSILLILLLVIFGFIILFTAGECVVVKVLYSTAVVFFLGLGCLETIQAGHIPLLVEYGTAIEVLTFLSSSVWVILLIGISLAWYWSQNILRKSVLKSAFCVIFLIGVLSNGFLFVCSDLDTQEVEMRKNISSASSVEYTEEDLYYRISNDIDSRAVEVIDIIKEKGKEDLYIVEIEGKYGVFTKRLSKSEFDEKIGYDSTHVTANYVTFKLVGYTSPRSVGYSYTATTLLLSDDSLDRNYYVTKALDYFNGDFEEGPHRLWHGDLSVLQENGYALYSHSRNED